MRKAIQPFFASTSELSYPRKKTGRPAFDRGEEIQAREDAQAPASLGRENPVPKQVVVLGANLQTEHM
ncbi:hypothetical protein [Dyella sp.]|uniref:hypothetical protein n=1 Tax=Dyella sp. TaxID=1869338 RepID=UPI002B472ECC|nr:hypothetical protein [Dyella sp.]HKT27802.1 hypothetical protein [Dyella sp.]